jgi:copper(I)-binding protein
VSRNRRRHARTVAGAVAAGVLAVTAVSGCGAGFSAETNHVTGSVNGQDAVAANILVRNAWLRGPAKVGEQTELYMFLINRGGDDDRLSAIQADFATAVLPPGGVALKAGVPVSFLPSSPDKLILRGLTDPLDLGTAERLTLVFDRAGNLTLDVPVQSLQQAQNQP